MVMPYYLNEDIPLNIIIVTSDKNQIKFSTKMAQRNYGNLKYKTLNQIDFGVIHTIDILKVISELQTTNSIKEFNKIISDDDKSALIIPNYRAKNGFFTLKSFILIEDLNFQIDDSQNLNIFKQVFPCFENENDPDLKFENDKFVIFSVKLLGYHKFAENTNPNVFASFVRAMIMKMDEITGIKRVSIRNDSIFFVYKFDKITPQNVLISTCFNFASNIKKAVKKISKSYQAPIECSVLFKKCEAAIMKNHAAKCGQSDFLNNFVSFLDECHTHFKLNAVGFVPRQRYSQIQNMTKIMSFNLKGGGSADIFLYI